MTPEQQNQQAKGRYTLLTVLRATGVLFMLAGIALMVKPMAALPGFLGQLLFMIGVIEALVLPSLLARSWRS
jgi:hypothetical protein